MKGFVSVVALLAVAGYWLFFNKSAPASPSLNADLPSKPIPTTGTTLALKLKEGQVWTYRLKVDRENPKESGEMTNAITISDIQPGQIDMQAHLVGFKIDGKDRMADLHKVAGEAKAVIPWNEQCVRVGVLQPMRVKDGDPKVLKLLSEAGFYCGNFRPHPVNPGDKWGGSVTATGGCTSATYTFKALRKENGKEVADFEVTDIAMSNHDQDGPMKVVIDVESGMPLHVEYKVTNYRTNQKSRFVQELVDVKRA